MIGARCLGYGLQMSRSLFFKPSFRLSTSVTHLETVSTFIRTNPLSNNLALQNLSELMQAKREIADMQLCEVTSISELISMIMRGTLTAKCSNH